MQKINVAVIMGGVSSEHEVSIKTGSVIMDALDEKKYNIKPITIDRNGKWLVSRHYITELTIKDYVPHRHKESRNDVSILNNAHSALFSTQQDNIDVVFIALHGTSGEDGTLQGLLELAGIPYTGSGVLASALAMDKTKSMALFEFHGLSVPRYISFTKQDVTRNRHILIEQIENMFGFPCILKPRDAGSSIGVYIIQRTYDIAATIKKAFDVSHNLMFQEYLTGDEVTCAVLDTGDKSIALPPTHIILNKRAFFDYHSKYTSGSTEEITPPLLPPAIVQQIQETALRAHSILGCSGLSRTDMIVKDDRIYVLEVNTIPGMTETSLYPQAAQAVGISFSELLDRLIYHALQRYEK